MKTYTRFLAVWVLNFLLFMFANAYFKGSYVLGNAVVIPPLAAALSSFLLTVFTRFGKSLLDLSKKKKTGRLQKFIIYSAINILGVWILAKISPVSGFGIPSFYYAIYLGLAASIFQWLLRQMFKATKLL